MANNTFKVYMNLYVCDLFEYTLLLLNSIVINLLQALKSY